MSLFSVESGFMGQIGLQPVQAGADGRPPLDEEESVLATFERVQLRELTVIKKTGRRVPFDRDKLVRSLQIALRKRSVEPERVERMVSGLVRRLENMGESEIASSAIGHLVMEALKTLDDVHGLLSQDTDAILEHFRLDGYDPHPALRFKVAV